MYSKMDCVEAEFCYLTTRGRRSGKPHRIEIWFAAQQGALYLMAGGRDSADWVRNLRAEPAVQVEIDGVTRAGRARVIEGEPAEPTVRRLLAAKYQGWREGEPLSEWARTALPVAIEFVG